MVGTGATISGKSLGRYGIKHPWRIKTFKLVYSQVSCAEITASWNSMFCSSCSCPVHPGLRASCNHWGANFPAHHWSPVVMSLPQNLLEFSIITGPTMSGLVQNFEYFIFCCIVTHVVVITSESGNTYGWIKSHKTAAHALDVLILCIYR